MDITRELKHAMDMIVVKNGHAAPVNLLAIMVHQQGQWSASSRNEALLSDAAAMLTKAGEILQQLETEEEEARGCARAT